MMRQHKTIYGYLMTIVLAISPVFLSFQSITLQKHILIVYLSRTGNTKVVAEMIQQNVGGELIAIEVTTTYPENYKAAVAQVSKENETGYLPPLKTAIENMSGYDIVFIGFPTWGMQLPPPMKTFLTKNNLNNKTIIPFNTNGGYGIGSSFETIKQLCPKSKILSGFSTRGGLERDGELLMIKHQRAQVVEKEIIKWLKQIKLL